jgi:hypothetical protein
LQMLAKPSVGRDGEGYIPESGRRQGKILIFRICNSTPCKVAGGLNLQGRGMRSAAS